ncbi:polysaccharide biosynthesis tyrosine autokinase [Aquimarina sp. RZ0]|uniref:GumC family protein n=1 Tax=Aquimarina sp. RZ0 TaxID=2607730 RepID=UPI0011F1C7EA|nr:polysaccharide biosynthesis tyrosine autokinase [Aquimarina sp. RZ0]KAA1246927.1 polysaccharide biosynthesis tyrosine autokinase [Aquimarina sp. RZ0]
MSINLKSEIRNHQNTLGNFDNTLKNTLLRYLKKWYWYAICVLITLSLAFIYLRYTPPQYKVTSKILIDDSNESNSGPDLSTFNDLMVFNKSKSKLENEIELLRSRNLMIKVIKKLELNVRYYKKGRVLEVEDYPESNISINLVSDDSIFNKRKISFPVRIDSEESYTILDEKNDNAEIIASKFGATTKTEFGDIIITPNTDDLENRKGQIIKIEIVPLERLADSYNRKLSISQVGEQSTVLNISFQDLVKEKARDILNTLIEQYKADDIQRKKTVSKKTTKFVNERISDIEEDLTTVDNESAGYKSKNLLTTDIGTQSQRLAENDSRNLREINTINNQMILIEEMRRYVADQQGKFNMIPSNLGFSDGGILDLVGRYNALIARRNSLLRSSSEQNPIVVTLDEQIVSLQGALLSSLNNLKNSTGITLKNLEDQNRYFTGKLYRAPKQQKDLIDIQRKINIKEDLFLYLLKKKEEAAITSQITESNIYVVDEAIVTRAMTPVSPKRKIIYLGALLLGFLIPTSFLYIHDLMDVKVRSKSDVESLLTIPFMGSIPKAKTKKNKVVVSKNSRTSISEAFRIQRTNLDFLMAGSQKKSGKIVFVTSTISGEGKTLVSSNLAKTLAISNKKVAYLGTDFRDPKIHNFFDLSGGRDTIGFTNYIMNSDIATKDIVYKTGEEDSLYIIPSGLIPPNPAELLMNDRVKEMFDYLEANFDYIVVDTAPVSLVTDTLLISHYADLCVYIVRENYSDKRILEVAENLYRNDRLPNMAVLLNAESNSNIGYGYGYRTKS